MFSTSVLTHVCHAQIQKPVLNLSKAGFLIYLSLAVDGGEIKESYGCEQRLLSSLTEKKEQGTSVSQGKIKKQKELNYY